MARSKQTKTHNIFLIDSRKLPGMDETPAPAVEASIQALMEMHPLYHMQELKPNVNSNGFTVELYFRGEDNYQSKFASFCKAFVKENQEAVTFLPRTASSVLFIWNDKHIYAITTGQGFRVIESYAVPKFGLIVASIFQDRFKITSLDSNAMSSIIHSTKTVYSNEVDFIDVNALDTVFKEITGRLKDASAVKSLLNLKETSKRQSIKVTAKNYVQFSSALDYNGLIHLLTIIDGYDFEHYQDRFNLIVPMSSKKHDHIIERNNEAVIEEMYNAITADRPLPYDLFHENTSSYIAADTYVIYEPVFEREYYSFDDFADPDAVKNAFHAYLGDKSDSLEAFSTFIKSVKIRAEKEGVVVSDAPLLQHVSGEIRVSGKNYFIFYGKYYCLNRSYTERLNDSLRGKLRKDSYTQEIKTEWRIGKDEDWFNKEVSDKEGFIHLHKVKPDYIEFADLMKYENGVVTVVHVKDGFDCDMRALDRQVELSIAKILDIRNYNNESYLRRLYEKASVHDVGKNIVSVFPTQEEFLECLKNNSIRYVILVRPTHKDLLDNTSNIAKHCLNALILRCFQQGFELKIQVK